MTYAFTAGRCNPADDRLFVRGSLYCLSRSRCGCGRLRPCAGTPYLGRNTCPLNLLVLKRIGQIGRCRRLRNKRGLDVINSAVTVAAVGQFTARIATSTAQPTAPKGETEHMTHAAVHCILDVPNQLTQQRRTARVGARRKQAVRPTTWVGTIHAPNRTGMMADAEVASLVASLLDGTLILPLAKGLRRRLAPQRHRQQEGQRKT